MLGSTGLLATDSLRAVLSVVWRTGDSYDILGGEGAAGAVLEGAADAEEVVESGTEGCCSMTGVTIRSCFSIPSWPRGVAIPAPGVLMGNSSSSTVGIGIGPEIFPRIEDALFV